MPSFGSIIDFLTRIDPLLLFILAVTLGVLGLVLLVIYRSKLNADRKSKNWPSTSGTITLSRIEKRAGYRRSGQGSRSTIYIPLIKYSYAVMETQYHGDRIGNGIYQSITRPSLNHWLKRYPAKSFVTVYYNPEDPADALLEPTSNSNIVGFIVGIGITALGVFLFGLWVYGLLKGH